MTSNLFQQLHQVLANNEEAKFHVTRKDDQLVVVFQPLLAKRDDVDEDDDTPVAQARAALALPLRVAMSPTEIDAEFAKRLNGYGEARAELRDSFDQLMEALGEATKSTKNAAKNKNKGKAKKSAAPAAKSAGAASGPAKPAGAAGGANPTSL
jgi:PRTRC genetic system protein E